MRMGINLGWVAYYQTDVRFTDLMVAANPWNFPTKPASPPPLAPDGITPAAVGAQCLPATQWFIRPGTYTIRARGVGQLYATIIGLANAAGVPYTNAGQWLDFTGSESYDFAIPPEKRSLGLIVKIAKTDATNPLSNIQIVPAGTPDPAPFWDAKYLSDHSGFSAFRFEDWTLDYTLPPGSWASRNTRPGYRLEDQIDLCNRLDTDGWWTLPYWSASATGVSDWPGQFGALLASNLKPGLKAYIQLGDELWNYGRPWIVGFQWTVSQGKLETPPLSGWHEAARLSKRMADAVKAAAGPVKVVHVLGGQTGYNAVIQGALQQAQADGWLPDAIAGAAYFRCITPLEEVAAIWTESLLTTTPPTLAAQLRTDAMALMAQGMFFDGRQLDSLKAIADSAGVPLVAYEGGYGDYAVERDPIGKQVTAALWHDPLGHQVYMDHFRQVTPYFNLYNHYSDTRPDLFGPRQADDDNSTRWQAIKDYARTANV